MTEITNIDLPNNWIIAKLSDMVIDPKSDFVDGPFGSNLKANEYRDEGVPVFRIQNIKAGYFLDKNIQFVTPQKAEQIKRHSFKFGDIIITKLGEPLGLCCKVPAKYPSGIIVADLMRVRPSDIIVNTDYLVYAINSKIIQDQFKKITKGTTRARVNLTIVRDIEIPLAPLNEQNRIVDKLDELLSELEKGKEQLQTSLEQLKVYRQSILKQAFEGKVTNEITIEGELPEGWKYKSVEEISSVLGDGLHGTPKYTDSGDYYFINGNNLSDGIIEIKPNTKRVSKSEFEKYKKPLNENTVFVSINGSIGYTAFYNNEKVILGKSACYFNVIEGVSKYYVRYYIKSNDFIVYANKEATGSTIKNLGLRAMRDFQIPFPPTIEEQNKIVQEIEKQFSICQNLEETLLSHIEIAEGLKKSILIKAFEGKLVEQDLTDEPASVLLERIKKEREEYLKLEKERKKTEKPLHIKSRKMAEELKRIIEILKESKEPVSAKILWQSSTHKDDIDDFYAALKKHIESGEIIELPRKGKESFLKLADAK